jgi:hypothetical protein
MLSRGKILLSVIAVVGVALLIALGASQQPALINWPSLLDAAARYALAVPSAILAAMAVRAASDSEPARGHPGITRNLRLAALGFAGYAAAQLFVHAQAWFPANLLNQEVMLAHLGLPIQAVRGALAQPHCFGLCGPCRPQHERQQQFIAAHQARLEALEQQDRLRRDSFGTWSARRKMNGPASRASCTMTLRNSSPRSHFTSALCAQSSGARIQRTSWIASRD